MKDSSHQTARAAANALLVKNLVRTRIPTRHGEFLLYYYNNTLEKKEHLALVKGNVDGAFDVPVRMHSECLTGDVFGSLRCDCGDQLERALRIIGGAECGVLLYLRQEGRGIGLLKKMQAYNLQDEGLDTVEANLRLGHRDDERDYRIAAAILKDLNVQSVRLITNNPAKIAELHELGVDVSERIPIEVPFNAENEGYLRTKARKMQHLLSLQGTRAEFAFMEPLLKRLERNARSETAERPFVTLSYAQSLDGGIAADRSANLTSERTRRLTQFLRDRHDGLLVGVDALRGADQQRPPWSGEHPQAVIVDPMLRFPAESDWLDGSARGPIIVTASDAPTERIRQLTDRGARVLVAGRRTDGRLDLAGALRQLRAQGLSSLIVEGGDDVLDDLLQEGLVDYCVVTIAPKLTGAADVPRRPRAYRPLDIVDCHYHVLDADLIAHGPLGKP